MPMAKIREHLGVGESYFSAMKNAMGLKYAQMGFLSDFSKFLRENPTFRQSDIYPRKPKPVAA